MQIYEPRDFPLTVGQLETVFRSTWLVVLRFIPRTIIISRHTVVVGVRSTSYCIIKEMCALMGAFISLGGKIVINCCVAQAIRVARSVSVV